MCRFIPSAWFAIHPNLHELRKRTKDLLYELELLCCVWPEMIGPLVEQAHHLTDLLGDDHDLAVLRAIAQEDSKGALRYGSCDACVAFDYVHKKKQTLVKRMSRRVNDKSR